MRKISAAKKLISLLLAATVLFSLSSCMGRETNALSVNGVAISNDVYTYFLDQAFVELGDNISEEDAEKKANELVSSYFKKNSLVQSEGISLSTAEKAEVSEKVNATWGIYGEYYIKLGVTKETLTKVYTADAERDALLMFYYGEGGKNEISVARLYAEFKLNYVVFRSINGYFTYVDENGLTQHYSANDAEALVLKYQNMAALINAGEKTMEEAAEFLAESGYSSSVSTVVLKKGDVGYPDGFFDKVQSLETRKASVIGTTDYLFLVMRGEADSDSVYFTDNKRKIIIDIVGNTIDERIESSLETKCSLSSSVAQGLYLYVKSERTGA